MMPPFAGQGLNSGIRDAANLAWKLAEVWHGRGDPRLLETYELERRPHATATVSFSERLGRVVMTTRVSRALARDVLVRALGLTGRGRRYLEEMRFRPRAVHREGLVLGEGGLAGTLLPQPRVLVSPSLRTELLDGVLGDGFALLGVDVPAADWTQVSGLAPVRRVDVVLGERLPRLGCAAADVHQGGWSRGTRLGNLPTAFSTVRAHPGTGLQY
jgi:3-(3-hydroxy-phenyl)propionate hydroxylase